MTRRAARDATCIGDVASGAPFDTAVEGQHTFTVTATDNAGNVLAATVSYKVDGTAPAIHANLPVDGATYARGSVQHADYTCDDAGGLGVVSCVGPVPNGSAFDTSTLGDKTFTIHAADNVGNSSELTITYHVTDQTAPVITITSPLDGAHFPQDASVLAAFGCVDEAAGSGVATCVGTVADGAAINTSTYGQKGFQVDATDVAGNVAQKVVHYFVDDLTKPVVTVTLLPRERRTTSAPP